MLGGVKGLNLSHCQRISDVSALGAVEALDLSSWCSSVTAVTQVLRFHLRSVSAQDRSGVDLSFCSNITDVSMLGAVKQLKQSNCAGVSDASALGTVIELDMYFCSNVDDVSMLSAVKELKLKGCKVTRLFILA